MSREMERVVLAQNHIDRQTEKLLVTVLFLGVVIGLLSVALTYLIRGWLR